MSTDLNTVLFGISGDDIFGLEEEMRPDRIVNGVLENVVVQIRIAGKPGENERTLCAPSTGLTSAATGELRAAEMKRFLRWLADSLDHDMASLQLQVTGAEEHSELVQIGARRLASQAFA